MARDAGPFAAGALPRDACARHRRGRVAQLSFPQARNEPVFDAERSHATPALPKADEFDGWAALRLRIRPHQGACRRPQRL